MKIKDLQTGEVHEYGTNCHDSLYVSQDGRTLTYYNLQNGDGSGVGDYRFVCDDEKVPAESETADAIHCEVYFNIGGWNHEGSQGDLISIEEVLKSIEEQYTEHNELVPSWLHIGHIKSEEARPIQTPSCLIDEDRHAELLERYKEGGAE